MAEMAKVDGISRLLKKLRDRRTKSYAHDNCEVRVGFTAEYAVYVHENLEAEHPVGQAKFLEEPLRTMIKELVAGVKADVAAGKSLTSSLLKAGMRLQRAAQKLCPVDTGNLKNSAFTRLERGSQ